MSVESSPRLLKLRRIIFEADTQAGKIYDIALLITIAISVFCVMLDSVATINKTHGSALSVVEWGFTILFTLDYIVRLRCAKQPIRYAVSFFGIVDLLGVIPTYFGLLFPGTQYLIVIRFLRILRMFRVFQLSAYQAEARAMLGALRASSKKVSVFLLTVLSLVVVLGALMYVIESPSADFTSIPKSIYWAIVTLTTVGYGDISPVTPMGQALAAVIMILGYSIIVVPTGIVSVEIAHSSRPTMACPSCKRASHESDAAFCRHCGFSLAARTPQEHSPDNEKNDD